MLLTTPEAASLSAAPDRDWVRRLTVWAMFVLGVAAFMVMVLTTPVPICSAAAPCAPLPFTNLIIGVFAVMPFLAFADLRFAAGAGVVMAALLVLHDAVVPEMATVAWVRAVIAGYALLGIGLAWLVRATARPKQVQAWESRQEKALFRGDRVAYMPLRLSLTGLLLLLAGLACAGHWLITQEKMDGRQAAAREVRATILEVVDELTVKATLPGGEVVTINVADSGSYPQGSVHGLLVDDEGLRQPVAEPYDASPMLALGVILGGLAMAFQARRLDRVARRTRLFTRPQPVTSVQVRRGPYYELVYAGDATAHDGPLYTLTIADDADTDADADWDPDADAGWDPDADPDGDFEEEEELAFTAPVAATLHGTPLPGSWCGISIAGQELPPLSPLAASYDRIALHENPADPATALPERALTVAEAAALPVEEYLPDPHRLRVARAPWWYGHGMSLLMPLTAVPLFQKLPEWVSAPWVYAIVAAVSVGFVLFGWLLWIRPRVAWNGGGMSVRGVNRAFTRTLPWSSIREITVDGDLVFVTTGDGYVFGLPAAKRSGFTAEQLAARLRNARLRADAGVPPPNGAIGAGTLEGLVLAVEWALVSAALAAGSIWAHHWVST